jgi:hydroxylaminobenzene mutase
MISKSNAPDKFLIKSGFVLILLALLTGMFLPAMALPRLGLSAHTIGLMGGILLIAVGAVWDHFKLTDRRQTLLCVSWLYSSYVNWFACLLAAAVGAGRVTPLAAGGRTGPATMEAVVTVLLGSVALISFLAVGLSLYGLKSGR